MSIKNRIVVSWRMLLIMTGIFVLSCSAIPAYSAHKDDGKGDDETPVAVAAAFDKDTFTAVEGKTLVLTPVFSGEGAEELGYEWTSSNMGVATVAPDNDMGAIVTALSSGTTTITVACEKDASVTASCSVTVYPAAVRILAIGNSFSQDAVEQYLYELAGAEGIETIIGNMYIGGCSLENHLNNATNDNAVYEYRKIVDGNRTNRTGTKLSYAIGDEPWDYISLQQASGQSGIYTSFTASLPGLVAYVKKQARNDRVKLMLHQTWAYATTSTHGDFAKYDRDQTKMYNAIVDAVGKAAELTGIDIVIPSGTAIQNGRTSYLGDTFCRDGFHLETSFGRYTAACTWFETLFGKDVRDNSYQPSSLSDYCADMCRLAAHSAVATPGSVTVMTKFAEPEPEPGNDNDKVLVDPVYLNFGDEANNSNKTVATQPVAPNSGGRITVVVEKGAKQQ